MCLDKNDMRQVINLRFLCFFFLSNTFSRSKAQSIYKKAVMICENSISLKKLLQYFNDEADANI